MKILAEIPLQKGFESERFQVSTALSQHVNEPSFLAQQQVPRFPGSSVAFMVSGLGTMHHSPTQRLKPNTHCCWEQNVCKQDLQSADLKCCANEPSKSKFSK